MRQAGVLAAAGIVALGSMVDRLAEDHARAQLLASKLAELPGITLDSGMPQSNMVYLTVDETIRYTGKEFRMKLEALGLKIGQVGPRRYRMVIHYYVDDESIVDTTSIFQRVLETGMI
jgi:threonine aldolase